MACILSTLKPVSARQPTKSARTCNPTAAMSNSFLSATTLSTSRLEGSCHGCPSSALNAQANYRASHLRQSPRHDFDPRRATRRTGHSRDLRIRPIRTSHPRRRIDGNDRHISAIRAAPLRRSAQTSRALRTLWQRTFPAPPASPQDTADAKNLLLLRRLLDAL